MVKHLIVNLAVIGEYTPRDAPAVPDYYPAVVSEEEWLQAQAAISRRNHRRPGRPGVAEASLFTGLIFDAVTKEPLVIRGAKGQYRERMRYRYLCTDLSGGTRIRYEQAEAAILEAVVMLRPEDVLSHPRNAPSGNSKSQHSRRGSSHWTTANNSFRPRPQIQSRMQLWSCPYFAKSPQIDWPRRGNSKH